MSVQALLALASGVVSIILVPLTLYGAKYYWDRRRWRTFEGLIRRWGDREFAFEELTEEDWKALAAMKLTDAGFEPTKVKELIELAAWFAKGHASQTAFEKIGFRQKEKKDESAEPPEQHPR